MYRLIAFDVDGTLCAFSRDAEPGASMRVSPRFLAAAAQVQARGVAITLATGRGVTPILPLATALGINVPLICYQGGWVYDLQTATTLHRSTLPVGLAHQVVAWVQPFDWDISVYQDGEIYLQRLHYPVEFYDRWFGLPWHHVSDLRQAITHDPEKIVFTGEPAMCDTIHAKLNAQFGEQIQVLRTHELFVELVPHGTSKGGALAWLAAQMGIRQEEVIAVGDSENDLSMIRWAGMGIAMGNATAQVKAAARWQAPTVDDDGAAVVLEHFVLDADSATNFTN
ncbi:MAG: Cof-type HAD-IIB family hydrolase [Anaerolineae bacterium]